MNILKESDRKKESIMLNSTKGKPTGSPTVSLDKTPVSSARRCVSTKSTHIFSPRKSIEFSEPPLTEKTEDLNASWSAYKENWLKVLLGSTSGMMFILVVAALYALYVLCYPYGNSISFGILLSVVLHPRSLKKDPLFRKRCIECMEKRQHVWAEESTVYSLIGSILSLRHFVSYVLMQLVLFFGLNKLECLSILAYCGCQTTSEQGNKKVLLIESLGGRRFLRALVVCIVSAVAHVMIGFSYFLGMHFVLFFICSVAVILMPAERFVVVMWNVWRFALTLFFVGAVTYNLALDVLSINETVRSATTAVVNAQREWSAENSSAAHIVASGDRDADKLGEAKSTAPSGFMQFQEFVTTKAQQTILKELGDILNQSNATELAIAVREGFAPVLSSFPEELSVGVVIRKGRELYRSLFSNSEGRLDWVNIGQKLMERWEPFFSVGAQILIRLGTNMMEFFDTIYSLLLFVYVLRYFTQLEHTVLFYVMEKVLNVVHPKLGKRHARKIEKEITVSFFTLLLSFWHLIWFHFCITFSLFKVLSFITPTLCGMVSAFTAVFPLSPKWLSPIAFAFAYALFETISTNGISGLVLSQRVWWCSAALVASFADEWLLSVSRGIRGEFAQNAEGAHRKQLPTTVVGTAIVLGYVTYGLRGILIGPLTIIVVKVLFDNWDIVIDREGNSRAVMDSQESQEES